MNRDEIIRMAKESGWHSSATDIYPPLEHFARLVAAAEREACAKVCEEVIRDLYIMDGDAADEVFRCAKTIRARGKE